MSEQEPPSLLRNKLSTEALRNLMCADTDAIAFFFNMLRTERDKIKMNEKGCPEIKSTTLPQDSKQRKEFPLYSGLLKYFPSALASVASVSKVGNDKHNPGQELHHSRNKSSDHADCIIRHLIDMSEDFGKGTGRDENGVPQVAYIAWRALALCQEWLEKNSNAPLAPGAKTDV